MTKDKFLKLTNLFKQDIERFIVLNDVGVDLSKYDELQTSIIELLAIEVFGDDGWTNILRCMYEDDFKDIEELFPTPPSPDKISPDGTW